MLFEWHSLDHVPLDESHQPAPNDANTPYDYFHINSVSLDHDGNLLDLESPHVDGVRRRSPYGTRPLAARGASTATSGSAPACASPGSTTRSSAGRDTLRIFDNESNGTPVRPHSRIITVRLDPQRKTATLVRSVEHPDGLSVPSQGNSQRLPNGDLFVGWGRLGRFSEFRPDGQLAFDAMLPPGYDSYRAYRFEWNGHPTDGPLAAARSDGTATTVDAYWNGATDVARWRILAGPDPGALKPVATVAWNSLDTQAQVSTQESWVAVAAEDAGGHVIGRSAPVQSTG